MNFNLFLIVLIALIIIFLIILYNGLRILLTVEKEESIVKYKLKLTVLKIAIFKRSGTKGNDPSDEANESEDEPKDADEKSDETAQTKASIKESDEKTDKSSDEEPDESEDKSLKEKFEEIKPILKHLNNSKEELANYLKRLLKTIDLRKLEGNLKIGLDNHATTVKIASFIWSIGAIVNSSKPTLLTVEPKFTEEVIDFEGKMELKINLLILLFHTLVLLSKRNIIELIRELYINQKGHSSND